MTREHIISVLKRNDKVATTGIIARLLGADEAKLAPLLETTRQTDKFLQTVFDLVDFDEVETEPETTEEESNASEEAIGDGSEGKEPTDDGFNDVRKAIKKGKGKKALKLIKAHRANGSKGSVLKGLTNEAKAL